MAVKIMSSMVFFFLPMALSMKLNGVDAPHKMMLAASSVKVETGVDAPHKMALAASSAKVHTVAEMETAFVRSQAVHEQAMATISKTMTQDQALRVIEKDQLGNTSLLSQVKGILAGGKNLRKGNHDGFGGLDGARLLLNDMIHEVMVKYDAEIAKCTSYYAAQCALMEVARGQISAANFVAATSRALILDAQYNINKCEIGIPINKLELKDHNRQCKAELKKLDAKMKIILGDIAVMTMILEMSDCDAKFLQYKKLAMLKCKDACTSKTTVSFNHKSLEDQLKKLNSPSAKDLVSNGFEDMFDDDDSDDATEFVQVAGSDYMEVSQPPKNNKTKFNNPPVPRTAVPSNPCTDPNQGAPSTSKRGGKCTLKKSPRCYKLQGRFLAIQAEIADARDYLLDEISALENACEDTKKTLEASIANDGTLLSSSQTKLATAMEKESSAAETGRQVAKENQQYNDDLVKQMTTCSTNYGDFETELCALRKIRGDLFKKMKPGHPGFFQDCEVSPWSPETCSKVCAGGDQKLSRSVLTHPDGGCKCLPLAAERRCNLGPCPVNCILAEWGGWSKCSSKCGGGMASRVRDVKTPMQYGGKQCGSTGESKQCNVDACEKDCVLHEWTKWTGCTKDCDGGTKRRERMIKEPAEGSGKCADKWDPLRLQYEVCALHRCKVPDPTKVLKCNTTMDVVMVIDGTPKSGKDGFAQEIKAANLFVDAWTGEGLQGKPGFALIHYTGPRTWSGVSKCTGKSTAKVDMEKTCKITLVQHFTNDVKMFKGKLDGLEFVPGSKLLSLGLMTVQAEFALGNKNARTVVVVFIDGQPLSFRKTLLASRAIRKKARLVWVAVSKFAPLAGLKKWASRRWQENLVTVPTSEEMGTAETGTHIIANICPSKVPKLQVKKAKKAR